MATDENLFSFDFPPPSEPSTQVSSTASAAAINLNDTASGGTVRTRRERSDKGKSRGRASGGSAAEQQLSAEDQKAVEALWAPEQWRSIVSVPADVGMAVTGSKRFELTDAERNTMAVHAASTARFFYASHPKWLALTMLAISLTTVYGSRVSLYLADKRQEEMARKKGAASSAVEQRV